VEAAAAAMEEQELLGRLRVGVPPA